MNSIPSMDRHIQQTNDRLLCIKQVRHSKSSLGNFYMLDIDTWTQCSSFRNCWFEFESIVVIKDDVPIYLD